MKKILNKKIGIILAVIFGILLIGYAGWFGPKQARTYCSAYAMLKVDKMYEMDTYLKNTLSIGVENLPKEKVSDIYWAYRLINEVCLNGVGMRP